MSDNTTVAELRRVAVIGLGSMGSGMATALLNAGHAVTGFDVAAGAADHLVGKGLKKADTPARAVAEADIVVIVVVNAAQTESVLFGPGGLADALTPGAVVVSSATMNPEMARVMAQRLEAGDRHYLDAPMSGGAARAAEGELTFMTSGSAVAQSKAHPALAAMGSKIYDLGEKPGDAAGFKMVNQLLAGVHIAAACEAMTFAARLGLDLRKTYDVITEAAGNSWMFEDRMPHVIDGDYTPRSSVDIFVKDLGIVQDMARSAKFPVPVAASALQMFLMASGSGMGGDDDASVARIYAQLSQVELPTRKT